MKIAVLGSGGWGTALAMLLEENGHQVTLWSYLEQESKQLQATGENPLLPEVQLLDGPVLHLGLGLRGGQRCGGDGHPLLRGAVHRRADCRRLSPGTILVSVSKGIEKGTFLRMSQIIREATGDRFPVVTLSGPSHAEEVAGRSPLRWSPPARTGLRQNRCRTSSSTTTSASTAAATWWGVELGAALKNVMALCTGCCTGMGYGDNTKAMLMTRGLAEMARLGVALGGQRETLPAWPGWGTSSSPAPP